MTRLFLHDNGQQRNWNLKLFFFTDDSFDAIRSCRRSVFGIITEHLIVAELRIWVVPTTQPGYVSGRGVLGAVCRLGRVWRQPRAVNVPLSGVL